MLSAVDAFWCACDHFDDLAVSDGELRSTRHRVRVLARLSPVIVKPDRRHHLVTVLLDRPIVEGDVQFVGRGRFGLRLGGRYELIPADDRPPRTNDTNVRSEHLAQTFNVTAVPGIGVTKDDLPAHWRSSWTHTDAPVKAFARSRSG